MSRTLEEMSDERPEIPPLTEGEPPRLSTDTMEDFVRVQDWDTITPAERHERDADTYVRLEDVMRALFEAPGVPARVAMKASWHLAHEFGGLRRDRDAQ